MLGETEICMIKKLYIMQNPSLHNSRLVLTILLYTKLIYNHASELKQKFMSHSDEKKTKKVCDIIQIILVYLCGITLNCFIVFHSETFFFGSFLHNYALMIRNGKVENIVNDISNWKQYYDSLRIHSTNNNTYERYDMRDDFHEPCSALDNVFNQGSCPSCFAFALASMLGVKICKMNMGTQLMPSPYRIFDCAGNGCQAPKSGISAIEIVKVITEGVPDIHETPTVFGWGCQKGKIRCKGFHEVCGTLWIKRELLLNGPLIQAVDLYGRKKEFMQFHEWGDLEFRSLTTGEVDPPPPHHVTPKHAVMIIGWDLSPVPHWIIKNSWGHEWGELGIGRVPWSKKDCAFSFDPIILE